MNTFTHGEKMKIKNIVRNEKIHSRRDCYNSYFYAVEDESLNYLDQIKLHGKEMIEFLDGGSALHLNLEEYLDKEQFKKLINIVASTGCNYFCTNVKVTICNNCDNIDKRTHDKCPKCSSDDIDHATRVIGYLKRISSFSSPRQKEHGLRVYQSI